MHEPFRQAVGLCLPQAKVVADKFHVLMHVHHALDQMRTSLQPQRGRKGELFPGSLPSAKGGGAVDAGTPGRALRIVGSLSRAGTCRVLKEAFRGWYRSTTGRRPKKDGCLGDICKGA